MDTTQSANFPPPELGHTGPDAVPDRPLTMGFAALGPGPIANRHPMELKHQADLVKSQELQAALSEVATLKGEATVLRRLLGEADGVIGTIDPEDTHTADLLKELRREIAAALNPEPPAGGLF